MTITNHVAARSKDWARRPGSWGLWWGLPILIGISTNFWRGPLVDIAFVWMVAFGWMGTGCLLNARRCSRLHCYFSGPILWLGAIAIALVGAGVIANAGALSFVVSGTTILALLSFVPEAIWGRYPARR